MISNLLGRSGLTSSEKRDGSSTKLPQAEWVTVTESYRAECRIPAITTFAQRKRDPKRLHLVTTPALVLGGRNPHTLRYLTIHLPAGKSIDVSVVRHQGPEEERRYQYKGDSWLHFLKASLPRITSPHP